MCSNADLYMPRWSLVLLLCLFSTAPFAAVEIQLTGANGELDTELSENILGMLSMERESQRENLGPARIRELHQRAEREIRRALQPFGYYAPELDLKLTQVGASEDGEPSRWIAIYRVDPGPATLVRLLDIEITGEGRDYPEWSEAIARQPLREGERFLHGEYETTKAELLEQARELGFLEASLTRSEVRVDPAVAAADVHLQLDTGVAYLFGDALVSQEGFDEGFLRKYQTFKVGDQLDNDKLTAMRRALSSSGYFTNIALSLREDLVDDLHRIPVEVELENAPPNRYRARVGYGTDSGFGIRLDWQRRYLLQRGHHFNLGALAVQEKRQLVGDLVYQIPLDPLLDKRVEISARHEEKDLTYEDIGLEEGDETRIANDYAQIAYHHQRKLFDYALDEALILRYGMDSYSVFDLLFGNQPPEVQDFLQDFIDTEFDKGVSTLNPFYRFLVAGVEWTWRRSDDPIFPTDGEQIVFGVRGTLKGAASNTSFLQAELKATAIRPLLGRDRLILRTHLGYSEVESRQVLGATFNQMPESYEFRTGGDTSVRGYGYDSLVSPDAITGGRHLVVGSIEYERKILDNWSVAAFYDIGNAFNDLGDPGLKAGTGVGGRWYSPVGLVRLDLAFALDDDGNPWRVHFRVGPEF